MNHASVTSITCKTCHNGTYVKEGTTGALAKPTNHIPEAQLLGGSTMDCNACHIGTTVWTGEKMNHNNSQGNGSGFCKACHASGTSYLGTMQKKSLTHDKSGPTILDCSQSGCHRPLGNKGTAYKNWN
jgi:nitrate/TMAO reductase-like tetraheme cytochrome c subunit